MENFDLSRIKLNIIELYNELIIFIGDLSGQSSNPTPCSTRLSRLSPINKLIPYHVPNKDLLTISDLAKKCFSSLVTKSSSEDLALLLADYHLPSLIGHFVIMRKNPPRGQMVYFEFDSDGVSETDDSDQFDSAYCTDYDW
jgi:hypothetical protein